MFRRRAGRANLADEEPDPGVSVDEVIGADDAVRRQSSARRRVRREQDRQPNGVRGLVADGFALLELLDQALEVLPVLLVRRLRERELRLGSAFLLSPMAA